MIQKLQFEILYEFMDSLSTDVGVRELELGTLAHRLVAMGIHKKDGKDVACIFATRGRPNVLLITAVRD